MPLSLCHLYSIHVQLRVVRFFYVFVVGKHVRAVKVISCGIFICELRQLLKFLVVSGIQSLMYRLYGRTHVKLGSKT